MKKAIVQAGHAALAFLLLWSAFVQINDPDPWYWIAVYALAALLPLGSIFEHNFRRVCLFLFGLITAGVLMALPGFLDFLRIGDFASLAEEMTAASLEIEYAREFLGLLIALAVCLCYWLLLPASSNPENSS